MSIEMRGLYCALVTPYKANGAPDYEELERLVNLNKKNGISRFYVCGSSAEMPLLRLSERKEILRTVIGAGADYVIAHVGGGNALETFELAGDAAKAGANAVSAVTPYYYKYSYG